MQITITPTVPLPESPGGLAWHAAVLAASSSEDLSTDRLRAVSVQLPLLMDPEPDPLRDALQDALADLVEEATDAARDVRKLLSELHIVDPDALDELPDVNLVYLEQSLDRAREALEAVQ